MPEPTVPPLHVVLFRPEIPQNTGNVGRLCAFTGCRLHLIRPYGFTITDRHLRRSGMDYWKSLDLREHQDWEAFRDHPDGPRRLWLFTTHATQTHWDAGFAPGDGLIFGSESCGVPDWLHEAVGFSRRLCLPRFGAAEMRSLNLSTAAGIATYEALRQIRGSLATAVVKSPTADAT